MNCITLDDKVWVSDPCYDKGTWCQIHLTGVLPGEYKTNVRKYDDRSWGERCSVLLAVHQDYMGEQLSWRNHSGEVGVDSGQAGIFSDDTFRVDGLEMDTPSETYDGRPFSLMSKDNDGDDWYEKMCKFTLSSQSWGSYDRGVVSSSGIGDGGYRCLVAKKKGKIVGIAIDFYMEKFPNKDLNEFINN